MKKSIKSLNDEDLEILAEKQFLSGKVSKEKRELFKEIISRWHSERSDAQRYYDEMYNQEAV